MAELTKVVIAFDSFKGCMSSAEANSIGAAAVQHVMPGCKIATLTVADGGEGTAEALAAAYGCHPLSILVTGPMGKPVMATYHINDMRKIAVMDTAQACGMGLTNAESLNPMQATSRGVGEMIAHAIHHGAKKLIIGLGGSATNDGGMGLLAALGCKFFDHEGHLLYGRGEELRDIAAVDMGEINSLTDKTEITVLCDVTAPLLGSRGATYTFGAQKGGNAKNLPILEEGMRNFASHLTNEKNGILTDIPGTGAAGGIGFALASALNAKLTPGIEAVLNHIGFDNQLKDADLVITGEGKMDSQTSMGKTAHGILLHAKKYHVPVLAFCGAISEFEHIGQHDFLAVTSIQNNIIPLEVAMDYDVAKHNLYYNIIQQINIINYYNQL